MVNNGVRERGRGEIRVKQMRNKYKINKLQEHIVQHREHSQYFTIIVFGL